MVTGFAIAVPVGAVAALIVAVSANTSWRVGAAAGLGVATVDGAYAAVAVFAGTAAARLLAPLSTVLKSASVALLPGVALLILLSAFRPRESEGTSARRLTPVRAWLTFVAITAVNPTTMLYFVAVVLGGTVEIHGWVQGVTFAGAAFAASASWQIFIASVGSGLGESISSPLGRRVTAALGALAIAALALRPLL